MKNFILEIYNEFSSHITWPKWKKLQSSTLSVIISIFVLSFILYLIDFIFINSIKNLFSFEI